MKRNRFNLFFPSVVALASYITTPIPSIQAANLSLGADYFVRGVSVKQRNPTFSKLRYYDQRLQAYLITDLSRDVEATVRIQSITPWGLEGSTTPLVTRYPNANGTPWIQNAFIRLPNIWNNRVIVTVGRQPLQWVDGLILSDDDLGFNAIRAQIKSPWRFWDADLEAFTAKIKEGLTASEDTDLHGAMLGYHYKYVRWEFLGLIEDSDATQNYQMGASTLPFSASKIDRRIYGVHARTNLKDAYLKGAYFIQNGSVRRSSDNQNIKLGGTAYMVGLGGKANTRKIGRFGALLELAVGDGDKVSTLTEDEAFRPTFAGRWSGLERRGYGRYFAANLSDAYSPGNPFGPVNSTNSGLPDGTSGIQSIHFGVESTPFAQWSFTFDYFQFKAQKNLVGSKELGTEFNYGFVYRYSGLVTVRGSTNKFNPGEAFKTITTPTQTAENSQIEIEIRF